MIWEPLNCGSFLDKIYLRLHEFFKNSLRENMKQKKDDICQLPCSCNSYENSERPGYDSWPFFSDQIKVYSTKSSDLRMRSRRLTTNIVRTTEDEVLMVSHEQIIFMYK